MPTRANERPRSMRCPSGALPRGDRPTRWPLVVFAAFAALAAGCDRQAEGQPNHVTLATVNGEVIPASRLAESLRRFKMDHGQLAFRSERDLAVVRAGMLDEEIERVLVRQAAGRQAIEIDDEELERALLRRRASFPGRAFEEYLVEARIPPSRLKEDMRHRLLLQQIFGREVNPRVVVTDEEVRARYDEDPDAWALEEQVRARQIVVRTEDEARQILLRLRRGGDFLELARAHSLGPEGEHGGDLGWFTRGTMPSPIDEVCFELPVNRFSDVIESPYGFHVFQVTRRRQGRPRPLSEVARTIENELRLEKEHEAQRAYIERLKSEARINVDEAVLAEVR